MCWVCARARVHTQVFRSAEGMGSPGLEGMGSPGLEVLGRSIKCSGLPSLLSSCTICPLGTCYVSSDKGVDFTSSPKNRTGSKSSKANMFVSPT